MKRSGEHNHAGDSARVETARLYVQTKERAVTTQEGAHSMVTAAFVSVPPAVAAQLPSPQLLKRTIRNARNVTAKYPSNPESLLELNITVEYTKTHSSEDFLLFDKRDASRRILLFSTIKNIQSLSNSNTWYADGTFKVVPPLFHQLYTIHGFINGDVMPMAFILMASKAKESYVNVFSNLMLHGYELSPKTIITDFELAANNAFKEVFPQFGTKRVLFSLFAMYL